jgi:2-hydroxychromene-2-carboxylate isomerase
LRFPPEHPFNPLPLLRLAVACDSTADAVHGIFRFVWRDGRLPDLPIEWAELATMLGVPDAEAKIATAEVKAELRRNTDEAIARGVFGVPTLAIGNELFWGADATGMAADFVVAGCRFDDPEYARVAALPVGATRGETRDAERRDGAAKPVRKS